MAIDIASISKMSGLSAATNALTGQTAEKTKGVSSFESLLNSAMGMLKETEELTNAAEDAELSYMLGLNDSISDLMVAQAKANVSLQYTVAIKNAVLDAYKEIMQMQF